MASSAPTPGTFAAPHSSLQKSRDASHIIGFVASHNHPGTRTSQVLSQHNERLAPETLAWYYSLTSKSVKGLQLHKGDTYFIVLVMRDDRRFKLEYSHGQLNSAGTRRVGTVSSVPDSADLTLTRWICVDLIRNAPSSTSAPEVDMRFILSACYGASLHLRDSQNDNKLLFPLALAVSVTRKWVRFQPNLSETTGTSLALLWREVHSSPLFTCQSLWEKDISEEGRNEVRKWLFQAAREQIKITFPGDSTRSTQAQGPPSEPGEVGGAGEQGQTSTDLRRYSNNIKNQYFEQIFAASVVAWLEFSASKLEASVLAAWDSTWDANWYKNWREKWETSWEEQSAFPQVALIQLGKIVDISELLPSDFSTAIRASGRLSGAIARGASIEVERAAAAAKIPPDSVLERERQIIQQRTAGIPRASFKPWRNTVLAHISAPFEL